MAGDSKNPKNIIPPQGKSTAKQTSNRAPSGLGTSILSGLRSGLDMLGSNAREALGVVEEASRERIFSVLRDQASGNSVTNQNATPTGGPGGSVSFQAPGGPPVEQVIESSILGGPGGSTARPDDGKRAMPLSPLMLGAIAVGVVLLLVTLSKKG